MSSRKETNLEIAERMFVDGTLDEYIAAVVRLTADERDMLTEFLRGYWVRGRQEKAKP